MLDSINTLVAFALIFTVVSLLITVAVQMISSALNLRGQNLAWGITEAFEAIAPDLAASAKKKVETAGNESKNGFGRVWATIKSKIPKWVTSLGRKLRPETSEANALASHCLWDTLISDSQFMGFTGRATAVRADELFDLLHRISTGKKPGTSSEVLARATTLMTSLGVPASVFDARANLVEAVNKLKAIKTSLTGVAGDAANAVLELVGEAPNGTALAAQGKAAVDQWKARMDAAVANLEGEAKATVTSLLGQATAHLSDFLPSSVAASLAAKGREKLAAIKTALTDAPGDEATAVRDLVDSAPTDDALAAADGKDTLAAWKTKIEAAAAKLTDAAKKAEVLPLLEQACTNLTLALPTSIAERWEALGQDKIKEIYGKFEHWFETGQERAQEWFNTHARLLTAVFGLIAAFWLQLDTFDIYHYVATNREVRDKLVAQADLVTKQGEKVLENITDKVLKGAFDAWTPTLTATQKAAAGEVKVMPGTREKLKAELEKALKAKNEDFTPELKQSLDDKIDEFAKKDLAGKIKDFKGLKKSLDDTGFQLFPPDEGRWKDELKAKLAKKKKAESAAKKNTEPAAAAPAAPANAAPSVSCFFGLGDLIVRLWHGIWDPIIGWLHSCYVRCVIQSEDHIAGILCSALLLSLGAPFWFNTLKSLTSLRSQVAGNIEKEQETGKNKNKASEPPPTVK